jgi:universal stress protein E
VNQILVVASKEGQDDKALIRAVDWAEHFNAKITLIGFTHAEIDELSDLELSKLSRKGLEKALINKRRQELQTQIDSTQNAADIAIEVQWSKHITPAINAYCIKNDITIVLKSAHRSETMFYTPTDWKLMRECPAPIMITASKSWKKKPAIVASVDLKTSAPGKIELNHRVIKYASDIAQQTDSKLHIAYALKLPQALIDLDLVNEDKFTASLKQKIQPSIDMLCQDYNISPDNIHIKEGHPAKVIPSIASKLKADVVITGATGRKGVSAKLIGNTAEQVLTRLHTDIIVIK